MQLQLNVAGIILMLVALAHIAFPKYFQWKKQLSLVSLINRQMMYVHAFFIALVVFLMGLLCLTSANEVLGTALGKKIAAGLFIFWASRFFIQFFGYSSALWKGKKFETVIHIMFSFLWLYISFVFACAYWMNNG